MLTTSIDQWVKRILNLSENDVDKLLNTGIADKDGLRYTEFLELPRSIPVIKHSKLGMIGKYLANDGTLNTTIMVAKI